MDGTIARRRDEARAKVGTRAGTKATADRTRSTRQDLAMMPYRDAAAALSARSGNRDRTRPPHAPSHPGGTADRASTPGCAAVPAWSDLHPEAAPFVAATGAASTGAFTGLPLSAARALDPRDPPFPGEVATALEELQRWYADARDAVIAARDQMGRAAERFAEFAGTGVRSLRADAGSAGTLATLLFGAKGRMAGLLARVVVDALVADPGPDTRVRLAARLDEEEAAGNAGVATMFQELREALRMTTTVEELDRLRGRIRRARPAPIPGENRLYRDLLLALARDRGMRVSGDATNLRREGRWWRSVDPDRPFQLDGTEVADALNALDRVDPRTRRTFDLER